MTNLKYQLHGSYSVSGIQDYIEHIFKKHDAVTDNPSRRIYINKKENRIPFNKDRVLSQTLYAWNNEITLKH